MEFEKIINRMEELVSSSFDRSYFSHLTDVHWKPPLDVYESDGYFLVVVELAGIRKEDINITVEGGEISVFGERKNISPGRNVCTCRHMELLCGKFFRKVRLKPAVTGRMEATYEDGLLRITIFKETR